MPSPLGINEAQRVLNQQQKGDLLLTVEPGDSLRGLVERVGGDFQTTVNLNFPNRAKQIINDDFQPQRETVVVIPGADKQRAQQEGEATGNLGPGVESDTAFSPGAFNTVTDTFRQIAQRFRSLPREERQQTALADFGPFHQFVSSLGFIDTPDQQLGREEVNSIAGFFSEPPIAQPEQQQVQQRQQQRQQQMFTGKGGRAPQQPQIQQTEETPVGPRRQPETQQRTSKTPQTPTGGFQQQQAPVQRGARVQQPAQETQTQVTEVEGADVEPPSEPPPIRELSLPSPDRLEDQLPPLRVVETDGEDSRVTESQTPPFPGASLFGPIIQRIGESISNASLADLQQLGRRSKQWFVDTFGDAQRESDVAFKELTEESTTDRIGQFVSTAANVIGFALTPDAFLKLQKLDLKRQEISQREQELEAQEGQQQRENLLERRRRRAKLLADFLDEDQNKEALSRTLDRVSGRIEGKNDEQKLRIMRETFSRVFSGDIGFARGLRASDPATTKLIQAAQSKNNREFVQAKEEITNTVLGILQNKANSPEEAEELAKKRLKDMRFWDRFSDEFKQEQIDFIERTIEKRKQAEQEKERLVTPRTWAETVLSEANQESFKPNVVLRQFENTFTVDEKREALITAGDVTPERANTMDASDLNREAREFLGVAEDVAQKASEFRNDAQDIVMGAQEAGGKRASQSPLMQELIAGEEITQSELDNMSRRASLNSGEVAKFIAGGKNGAEQDLRDNRITRWSQDIVQLNVDEMLRELRNESDAAEREGTFGRFAQNVVEFFNLGETEVVTINPSFGDYEKMNTAVNMGSSFIKRGGPTAENSLISTLKGIRSTFTNLTTRKNQLLSRVLVEDTLRQTTQFSGRPETELEDVSEVIIDNLSNPNMSVERIANEVDGL